MKMNHWTRLALVSLAFNAWSVVGEDEWVQLGSKLQGRLHRSLPISSPCFDVVNGKQGRRNETECAVVQAGYTNPEFRVDKPNAFMFPQLESCEDLAEACLLDSTMPNNSLAWEGKECKQGSVSPYYIEVSGPEDVQEAFAFASKTGTFLSIKGCGHDYKGRSSMRGSLSLWTRKLNKMSYSKEFIPEGGSKAYNAVTLGAGVNFQEVYKYGEEQGFTFVGGYAQTIGASGGWVMGGGHSILSPVYGLGVDRVIEFKLVTPDGQYRIANEFQNTDLFWALRGGGGSTFGVVLESTSRVEPKMSLRVATISVPQKLENARGFLNQIINETYRWGKEGWGGHMNAYSLINVNPLLDLEQAKESVQRISDYALAHNGTAVVEDLPSWETFFFKYVVSVEAVVGQPTTLGSRLIPADLFMTAQGKEQVLNVTDTMLSKYNINPYIIAGTPFLYNYTESTTSVTPAWRNSLWQIGLSRKWNYNSTTEDIQGVYETISQVTQLQRDIAPNSGAYFNEGDVYEPNHEVAFWGDNYSRLLEIKHKYDPEGLLDCWQCVGWRGSQDQRYTCYIPR